MSQNVKVLPLISLQMLCSVTVPEKTKMSSEFRLISRCIYTLATRVSGSALSHFPGKFWCFSQISTTRRSEWQLQISSVQLGYSICARFSFSEHYANYRIKISLYGFATFLPGSIRVTKREESSWPASKMFHASVCYVSFPGLIKYMQM